MHSSTVLSNNDIIYLQSYLQILSGVTLRRLVAATVTITVARLKITHIYGELVLLVTA